MNRANLKPFTEDCWLAAALQGQHTLGPGHVATLPRSARASLAARLLETVPEARLQHAREEAEAHGVTLLTPAHPAYPLTLLTSVDGPTVLYVEGDLAVLTKPQLAIIGPRRMTALGEGDARRLAGDLAHRGWVITSGLALGIDGVAHRAALAAGGLTLAVLGSGHRRIYPAAHRPLAQAILERGAVVSEFPPTMSARPHHFPARNRIVSGLSQGVVVIEASHRSGALITARLAVAQGREVFVVPRHALDPAGAGGHRLLREGATLIRDARDIEESLTPEGQQLSIFPGLGGGLETREAFVSKEAPIGEADASIGGGNAFGEKIMQALQNHSPQSLDTLLTALPALSPPELLAQLSALELAGRLWLRGEQVHYLR
ncbi:MAG: DNA-protecting protein DprA [Pseudomonadales bacterium]|nr:DNA-protecting protein DprA [Pseudomonadales bacterium]